MPFIQINHSAELDGAARKAISLSIQEALVETFRIPADDYFQVMHPQPAEALIYAPSYLGVAHANPFVYIQLIFREGRSVAMKQELHRAIAAKIADRTPVKAANVFIVMVENTSADWSFGEGKAQMVDGTFEKMMGAPGGSASGASRASGASGADGGAGKGPEPEGLQRRRLLTAELGARQVTKVHVQEIRFAPGQKAGLHVHPCPVTGYILKGAAVLEVEGQAAQVLPAGSAFYEPAGARISRFDNQSASEEMVFTAFYLLNGEQPLIEMLKA
jgi:quercetin dioxygenase-like cupin family protein/phenylpyruvate tautomerase PptA (4-oxalocrotonate tautomerase family)